MIYALFVYIMASHLLFFYWHNRMINKLMSRDFYAYKMADEYKLVDRSKPKVEPTVTSEIATLSEYG